MRVGWIGIVANSALFGMKAFIGYETGSKALTADALFSILDVLSALLVIISFRIARKRANEEYPYGHGKIEFIAIAVVSLCIAAFAYELLERIIGELLHGERVKVDLRAAAAAIIACVTCYTISRYAECAAHRLQSPLLHTHAEHNKFDAISSLAVLVSIVLSWVGLAMLDAIVALLEIVDVVFTSGSLLKRGVSGLLDAVDPQLAAEITRIAHAVPGIRGVAPVRARHVGSYVWVELRVQVSPTCRMSEAGAIRARLRSEISARVQNVANVMVEILPELSRVADSLPAGKGKPWLSTS
jgi:cation diffusion facilitator family transporter